MEHCTTEALEKKEQLEHIGSLLTTVPKIQKELGSLQNSIFTCPLGNHILRQNMPV